MKTNCKILIVEDELLIAENLAMKLRKFGYTVSDIVSSGKAAIKAVEKEKPDLILMDISIKGNIDGIETASEIKQIAEIPVVFLTAYADDETLDRATQTNCYGYILKPFKDRELQATIKVVLNKHSEQSNIIQTLQEVIREYSIDNDNLNIDKLTQLPNDRLLPELFEYFLPQDIEEDPDETIIIENPEALTNKSSRERKLIGIVYIDLDRFQVISDSLGADSRDKIIKEVAERLIQCLNYNHPENSPIRIDNSQFLIMLPNLKMRQDAGGFANSILQKIHEPFIIEDREIFLTASIGISFYPIDNFEIEQLLKQAEQAMKYAQNKGGNQYQFYSAALNMMSSILPQDLSLETELHYALERDELEVYYQPQVDIKTGLIVGAETILRWNHPKMGFVPSARLLSIAETTGLIESIGEWGLKKACRQTKNWHQNGFDNLTIGFHLSARQFKQLDLFHRLTQILFDSNIEPQFLELELTEKILVENVNLNIQRLNLMKKLGIKIAIDDFGTGYSSLEYLQKFPFDTIKINSCFIKNVDKNATNSVITKAIIDMAHQLNLKVLAGGIKTRGEFNYLAVKGCDRVQGNLFGFPLTAKEFGKLLLSGKRFLPQYTKVKFA